MPAVSGGIPQELAMLNFWILLLAESEKRNTDLENTQEQTPEEQTPHYEWQSPLGAEEDWLWEEDSGGDGTFSLFSLHSSGLLEFVSMRMFLLYNLKGGN